MGGGDEASEASEASEAGEAAPHLHVTWRMALSPRLWLLEEVRAYLSPVEIACEAHALVALIAALRPVHAQAATLGGLAAACGDRFLLYGAYRHAWLRALDSRGGAPTRVGAVHLSALRLSVAASVSRCSAAVRRIADCVFGEAILSENAAQGGGRGGTQGGQRGVSLAFEPLHRPRRANAQQPGADARAWRAVPAAVPTAVPASQPARVVRRSVRWHYTREALRILAAASLTSHRLQIAGSLLALLLLSVAAAAFSAVFAMAGRATGGSAPLVAPAAPSVMQPPSPPSGAAATPSAPRPVPTTTSTTWHKEQGHKPKNRWTWSASLWSEPQPTDRQGGHNKRFHLRL